MILVSKFMVHRALSDKTYLSLGLLSPLTVSHLFILKFIVPDKAAYCVFTQLLEPENANKIHFCAYKNPIKIIYTQFGTLSTL